MNLLADAASSDFSEFNPAILVAAVNQLLSLGKDCALDAVERQLAEAQGTEDELQQGLFLVLRLLFEVPEDPGFHPPMLIGIPKVVQPRDPGVLPLFPLVVIDDIPFLLVTTFVLGGDPEPVGAHLQHFRRHGILRAAPLTTAADPESGDLLPRLTTLYRRAYGVEPKPGHLEMLEQQLQRMIDG